MAAKGGNITKEVGRYRFIYRHAKRLKPMEPKSPQRTPNDAPVVPAGGHKRCLGEFDQEALEPGLSQPKLKLKTRRGRTKIRVCKNTHCNGTKCQVYCERAEKRPRNIDNSCLPTDSYTNAELQTALQTQNLHKDTPLLTALRYRHLDRLEEYLRRLKASDAEAGTNSLKKILTIQNDAYDTCLTLAARDFYSEGTSGNSVSSLASTVQLLLDYCSSFPEIVMIRSGKGLTAIHLLLNHVPTALNQSDTLLFTLAESMVKLCPNVLTVKSRQRDSTVEEYPFEQLNRIKAEVAKELLTDDSVGAAALTRFSDCLKYLCIKQGYDLGVLYKVGEGQSKNELDTP
ncbi:hypothetical protein BGX38DRAFT_1267989 [Terfezia claveryi]|nr:hypothetical protein BGX38DRAFT_1267989 [Terfezia claveryi]